MNKRLRYITAFFFFLSFSISLWNNVTKQFTALRKYSKLLYWGHYQVNILSLSSVKYLVRLPCTPGSSGSQKQKPKCGRGLVRPWSMAFSQIPRRKQSQKAWRGGSTHQWARISDIRERLNTVLRRSQFRWFGHLARMPPGWPSGDADSWRSLELFFWNPKIMLMYRIAHL